MHTFYKKKMASRYTVLKRSALSNKLKRSTLLQEALRRIENIFRGLPWDQTTTNLSEYSNMLKLSGYNQWEWYHNIVELIIVQFYKQSTILHSMCIQDIYLYNVLRHIYGKNFLVNARAKIYALNIQFLWFFCLWVVLCW